MKKVKAPKRVVVKEEENKVAQFNKMMDDF